MSQYRILLAFGGESSEHDVSIRSARTILSGLSPQRYHVSLCYINRQGVWQLVETIDQHTADNLPQLTPQLGGGAFLIDGTTPLPIDVIFPALHGAHGEDGTVQGVAALSHIACVGPSVLSAAVSMDKDMTKRLAAAAGVPVVPWRTLTRHDQQPSFEELAEQLGSPLFVKPCRAGSSIGVHKAQTAKELTQALASAFQQDSTVLIEQAIDGREIELAVLGSSADSRVSTAGEIISGSDFYDYDSKYSRTSQSRIAIPAALDPTILAALQEYALTAYRAINGQGMARVDFFVTANNRLFLNEINSIPGFTSISMYPKLWQAAGVPLASLLDQLITQATLANTPDPGV